VIKLITPGKTRCVPRSRNCISCFPRCPLHLYKLLPKLSTTSMTSCVPRLMRNCTIGIERHFFFSWRYNPHRGLYFTALQWALASSLTRFLDHTQRRATVGRTPLNEWSVRIERHWYTNCPTVGRFLRSFIVLYFI